MAITTYLKYCWDWKMASVTEVAGVSCDVYEVKGASINIYIHNGSKENSHLTRFPLNGLSFLSSFSSCCFIVLGRTAACFLPSTKPPTSWTETWLQMNASVYYVWMCWRATAGFKSWSHISVVVYSFFYCPQVTPTQTALTSWTNFE